MCNCSCSSSGDYAYSLAQTAKSRADYAVANCQAENDALILRVHQLELTVGDLLDSLADNGLITITKG